jgi:hypothetical protein
MTTLHKDSNGTLTVIVTPIEPKPNIDDQKIIDKGEDALSYDFPYHESHSDVMKVVKHYSREKLST